MRADGSGIGRIESYRAVTGVCRVQGVAATGLRAAMQGSKRVERERSVVCDAAWATVVVWRVGARPA